MNITGAIFDMDGTLIDSMYIWDIIWRALGKQYLGDPDFKADPQFEIGLHVIPFEDALHRIKEEYHIQEPYDKMLAFFYEIIDDFYRNKAVLKPGVAKLLQHLYENGVKICIASGSNRQWVEDAVKLCKIEPYISRIFTCQEVGKSKNFPDIYRQALEFLGTPKESTWVFEDAYTALKTAHDFGLNTVGVYESAELNRAGMMETANIYIAPGEKIDRLIEL